MRCRSALAVVVSLLATGCSTTSDVTTESAVPIVDAGSSMTALSTAPTGSTVPASTEPADTTAEPLEAQTLDWTPCEDQVDGAPATECATLAVPLDHADPAGPTIDIAVARIDTADGDDQIGSLVLNPGGPGASGVEYLVSAAFSIPEEVQERFDLVGFDPRGVGASAAVECDFPIDDNVTLLAEGDDAGWGELVVDAERFLDTCDPASQDLLPWVGTNNAARDLDLLRAALGDERLTYVGYSYGTRLGSTYAELFPDRVRALVLDGAVKPTTDSSATDEQNAVGFDRALEHLAAACDADDDCLLGELGPTLDVIDGLRAEIQEVGSFPIDDPARVLTPGELTLGVFAALYSESYWPFLVLGLYVAEVDQDGSILQVLADLYSGRRYDGTYENLSEANVAINCADDAARRTADEQRLVSDAGAAASEHFPDFLRTFTGCLGIPPAVDPLIVGPATGAPPILVVGTTGDPATPYEWAVELADFLDSGVLYTVEGEGHTAYGSIDCASDAVNAYLIDLELPDPESASCTDDSDTDVFPPLGETELEQTVALLDCLRDEGVDLPEIGLADLLADPMGEGWGDALDPGDPAFSAAVLACQDLIPAD